jgi:Putative peptidoglycan binding domain
MPRRRRRASAVAVEADAERGLAMRFLLHSPKDVVAGAFAFAAVSAIIANALFLQAGRHPAPMFGPGVAIPAAALAPANLLPRPRPAEADASPLEPKPAEPKPAEPKATDPLANLIKATSAPPVAPSNIARPPAPIPVSSRNETIANSAQGSRRVAEVQRALTEYGYGQLKPTGTVGSETQAAIQKFERERKIPVTGQMSDRLVHELTAVIGHPID